MTHSTTSLLVLVNEIAEHRQAHSEPPYGLWLLLYFSGRVEKLLTHRRREQTWTREGEGGGGWGGMNGEIGLDIHTLLMLCIK